MQYKNALEAMGHCIPPILAPQENNYWAPASVLGGRVTGWAGRRAPPAGLTYPRLPSASQPVVHTAKAQSWTTLLSSSADARWAPLLLQESQAASRSRPREPFWDSSTKNFPVWGQAPTQAGSRIHGIESQQTHPLADTCQNCSFPLAWRPKHSNYPITFVPGLGNNNYIGVLVYVLLFKKIHHLLWHAYLDKPFKSSF